MTGSNPAEFDWSSLPPMTSFNDEAQSFFGLSLTLESDPMEDPARDYPLLPRLTITVAP
ncbi:hypothetical protein AB0K00_14055 [Dactylosporangium sp. NPDC049525]|uniref:hypothetical protein n=1 Tax=Dactylosporangium sp. NPDC049525 TaxID=3154730 RepID=UPI003429D7B8